MTRHYGYLFYRLRSSRRWEQAPHRHVAWLGLVKTLRPEHKTIADCRKQTLPPIRPVCRPFPLLGQQLDLFGAELVAIDGSKVRAVNAQARYFTPAKLPRPLAQLDEGLAAACQALDRAATQEAAATAGDAVAAQ